MPITIIEHMRYRVFEASAVLGTVSRRALTAAGFRSRGRAHSSRRRRRRLRRRRSEME